MNVLAVTAGLLLLIVNVWDAFKTILLPRRISGRIRPTLIVTRSAWWLWSRASARVRKRGQREYVLSLFPMLTMLVLFIYWAGAMILGFALVQWGFGSSLDDGRTLPGFATDLYMSGTTFFTLGLGDVRPISSIARFLTVLEAGTGFAFLAMAIAYLPVLYQAFSKREARITVLDEWAGSPPSGVELLRRTAESGDPRVLVEFLREWELWSAALMETMLSYPILGYFRSQHDNQSWLSGLTSILDGCALVIVGVEGVPPWQARLTFAMARHTLVDLSQVFHRPPLPFETDRLPPETLARVREVLAEAGVPLREGPEAEQKLAELRAMYEPYARALGDYLMMPVPAWISDRRRSNWQTTAWERTGADDVH